MEFKTMVTNIRQLEESMGVGSERVVGQGEQINRQIYAKSLISTEEVRVGDVIDQNMIEVKSPREGLQPNRRAELLGRRSQRDMKKGDSFFTNDLVGEQVKVRNYRFNRPGVSQSVSTILKNSGPSQTWISWNST